MSEEIDWKAEWEAVSSLRIKDANQIAAAFQVIERYGQTDGAHHKQWVIDQVVRCLLGCPKEEKVFHWPGQRPYVAEVLGENDAYREWVRQQREGVDGPHTYDYDEGIAP